MAANDNQANQGSRHEHTEEPNTGMRVGGDGNKIHGDDLEEMIPGRGKDRVRRGAETFDIEGERVVKNRSDKLADDDSAYEDNDDHVERGVEQFDIASNDRRGEDIETDYKGT
jgi:N-methylhydantoinase B/oxoprolinase/acetone carboxylase alpha subunit